jgi:Na+/H+ antiporter NhaD/arsenite permease-like protein
MQVYWVTPFCVMLLAIALLPLWASRWWEKNTNKLCVALSVALPVLVYLLLVFPGGGGLLLHAALHYFSFIVLLASLFIVSGGVYLSGDLRATPLNNTLFLLVGSLFASLMGTTGASMILIRPLLNSNKQRSGVVHTVIFFIFLVGNIGGCLTPLGDPPLFMGYLAGVPFQWTFRLLPQWALTAGIVLLVYFIIDSIMYGREPIAVLQKDMEEAVPLRLEGGRNLLFLAGIVLTVAIVQGEAERNTILVVLTLVSYLTTKGALRAKNEFTFYPIVEVAVIFLGIFLTMIPTIYLLRTRGGELGISEPWQFFWSTGVLSSFLDNTPTYVVFFNLAQGLNLGNEIAGMPVKFLEAISLGAVFFGANTYIGNAPNFMIKAIAEERKVEMPSFFGYMVYSTALLVPVFFLVSYLWF